MSISELPVLATSDGSDDLVVLARVRAGDHAAFAVLVERHEDALLRFARTMLRSTEDAQDAVQDVFAAAYSALLRGAEVEHARAWLYRATRNRCLAELKRRQLLAAQMATEPLEDRSPVVLTGRASAEEATEREHVRLLFDDVRSLPPAQRQALVLRELGALSYASVASELDISVSGVKSLLVRARQGLTVRARARELTCDAVRRAAAGPLDRAERRSVDLHLRMCAGCAEVLGRPRHDYVALAPLSSALLGLKLHVLRLLGVLAEPGLSATSGLSCAAGACGVQSGVHLRLPANVLAGVVAIIGGAGAAGPPAPPPAVPADAGAKVAVVVGARPATVVRHRAQTRPLGDRTAVAVRPPTAGGPLDVVPSALPAGPRAAAGAELPTDVAGRRARPMPIDLRTRRERPDAPEAAGPAPAGPSQGASATGAAAGDGSAPPPEGAVTDQAPADGAPESASASGTSAPGDEPGAATAEPAAPQAHRVPPDPEPPSSADTDPGIG